MYKVLREVYLTSFLFRINSMEHEFEPEHLPTQ